MKNNLLIVSDFDEDMSRVKSALRKYFMVTEVSMLSKTVGDLSRFPVMVVSFDLKDGDKVSRFRDFCAETKCSEAQRVFLVDPLSRVSEVQSANLGARQIVARPVDVHKLHRAVCISWAGYAPLMYAKPNVCLELAQHGLESLVTVSRTIQEERPISKATMTHSAVAISEEVGVDNAIEWLQAVNQHHSYTFRHSLHVAGLTSAFADHLKFNDRDKTRIVLGALMHDIGKARVPIEILDKPGPLNEAEIAIIKSHAIHGHELIKNDSRWDALTKQLVYEHHEVLDGTGYPNGLTDEQIIDPVRMLTIVDIFSALVDKRAYKDAMPPERAMKILYTMTDKIDFALLKAFEPVAMTVLKGAATIRLADAA